MLNNLIQFAPQLRTHNQSIARCRILQGHFQYYNDNWKMLMKFREVARVLGLRWMRRRSQKGRDLSWEAYERYLERHPLPNPGQITDLIAMGSTK